MYAYGANSTGGDFMITGMAPYTKARRDNFLDKITTIFIMWKDRG